MKRSPLKRSAKPIARSPIQRKPGKPIARKPVVKRRRKPKAGDDPQYCDWIRSLACLICFKELYQNPVFTELAIYPTRGTECAHVGNRGFGQKCPDRETVPLCEAHHRTGKEAHHVLGKRFWQYHELDREAVIGKLNQLFDSTKGDA